MTYPFLAILLTFALLALSSFCCTVGVAGCSACLNTTHCIACQSGHRIKLDLTCQPCSNSNCKQCMPSKDICLIPKQGFGILDLQLVDCHVDFCASCNQNPDFCTSCIDSYILTSNNTCQICTVLFCKTCSSNNMTDCSQCLNGYYLQSNSCYFVNISNCLNFNSSNGQCVQCEQRFGLLNGTCVSCLDPVCRKCNNDLEICTQCQDLFGVFNNTCVRCFDSRCMTCQQDASICTVCRYQYNYGLNFDGQCVRCQVPHCAYCSANVSFCQSCNDLRGVDHEGNCVPCADINCRKCPRDHLKCIQCKQFYGFDSNSTCVLCFDNNCSNCLDKYQNCTKCKTYYGFYDQICIACLDSQCFYCFEYYENCSQCINGYGVSTNLTCQLCTSSPSYCLSCHVSNLYYCHSCPDGRYRTSQSICELCPIFCQLCHINGGGVIQCTKCIPNITKTFYIIQNYVCIQVPCGDLQIKVVVQQCDNSLQVPYDGCSDVCTVQDNFTCLPNLTTNGSVCSYLQILQIKFIAFDRVSDPTQVNGINDYSLKISVSPALHVFKISSEDQLKKVFTIFHPSLKIINLIYNSETGVLQFKIELMQNILPGTQIQINFSPNNSDLLQYSLTPGNVITISLNKISYYTSPADITLGNVTLYICYAIIVLGWTGFLLGVFMKRLAGLQAMFVVQIGFFTYLLFPLDLLYMFGQTYPLKFATGYNHKLISGDQDVLHLYSVDSPFYTQFKVSQTLLVNNFNFCMITQILGLILILIARKRLRLFIQKNNSSELEEEQCLQRYQRLEQLTAQYQFCFQFLKSSSVLNLPLFTLSGIIFIKYGEVNNIISIVIGGVQLIMLAAIFIYFVHNPVIFDYFVFSFRETNIAMKHYWLYIIVIIVTVGLLTILENLSYPSIIVPIIMLVQTLVYRPYKQLSENIRSAWNMLVITIILFYRVYLKQICSSAHLNSTGSIVYHMINIALILVTVVVAIVFTIYYYWAYKCKATGLNQDNQQNPKELSEQNQRRKLLNQLVKIDPNRQMETVAVESTFRELINPHLSLLNATNSLQQNKNRPGQNQNMVIKSSDNTDGIPNINKTNLGVISYIQNKANLDNMGQLGQPNDNKEQYKICKQMLRNEKFSLNNSHNNGKTQYKQLNIDFGDSNQDNGGIHNQIQCGDSPHISPNFSVDSTQKNRINLAMADPIMNNSIQKNTDTLRIYTLLNTTIDINDNKIKGQIGQAKLEKRREFQKQIAGNIVRDQRKFINLQAAVNLTKQAMDLRIEESVIKQYQKIDQFYIGGIQGASTNIQRISEVNQQCNQA